MPTDTRFLESLSTKVHPAPLSIEALSDMFQDFYVKAESHISTHIATMSSKISRERTSSLPLRAASDGKNGTKKDAPSRSATGEQQMLSASELLDRRKARRHLEIKRVALEEAIERAVCEKVGFTVCSSMANLHTASQTGIDTCPRCTTEFGDIGAQTTRKGTRNYDQGWPRYRLWASA